MKYSVRVFDKGYEMLSYISDELVRLHKEGYGILVEHNQMIRDKLMEGKNTFCAFVKNDIWDVDENFFKQVRNSECIEDMYKTNYNKSMDLTMKKVAIQYAKNKDYLGMTPMSTFGESKI